MNNKTSEQVFKQTQAMTQSKLARLLNVNRSTISRRACYMVRDEDGHILLHEKNTLIALTEVIDTKLNSGSWNPKASGTDEFMQLYKIIKDEATRLIWGKK